MSFGKRGFWGLTPLLFVASLSTQGKQQSASELIRYLTYQSGRPESLISMGMFSCGLWNTEERENLATMNSLVRLGPSAVPDIEVALSSLERLGKESKYAANAGHLLLAYAKIKGPDAFPRLQKMLGNSVIDFLQKDLSYAIAASLSMTSYVHSSQDTRHPLRCSGDHSERMPDYTLCPAGSHEIPLRSFQCNGGEGPRDALDRFVLNWETNNRDLFAWSIGENAKTSLAKAQTSVWPKNPDKKTAIGYRFDASYPWSKEDVDNPAFGPRYEFDTSFTDSLGRACGTHRVRFVPTKVEGDWQAKYLIDNTDLPDLLKTIGSCAGN